VNRTPRVDPVCVRSSFPSARSSLAITVGLIHGLARNTIGGWLKLLLTSASWLHLGDPPKLATSSGESMPAGNDIRSELLASERPQPDLVSLIHLIIHAGLHKIIAPFITL
jgi:hypothetical protein